MPVSWIPVFKKDLKLIGYARVLIGQYLYTVNKQRRVAGMCIVHSRFGKASVVSA